MRAADSARLKTIASLAADDQVRGRRVTVDCGAQDAAYADPAQMPPVSALGSVRWDLAAAMTAPQASATARQRRPPASQQPRRDRQGNGDAGKLLADRHRAACNGCPGECERCGQQGKVRVWTHQMFLTIGAEGRSV
jgi:hypothetical protein